MTASKPSWVAARLASAWSSSMRSWSFCRRLRRASQARVPAAKSGDAAEATNPVSSIVPAAMPVRPEWGATAQQGPGGPCGRAGRLVWLCCCRGRE